LTLPQYLQRYYLPSIADASFSYQCQLITSADQFDKFSHHATMAELTDDVVNRFIASIHKRGLAPATANTRLKAILALWRHAWRYRHLDDLPRNVRKLRLGKRLPEVWTTAEVNRILIQCRAAPRDIAGIPAPLWWESLVTVLYYTGIRIGSAMVLRTEHLNLEERYAKTYSPKTDAWQLVWLPHEAIAKLARIHDPSRDLVWPWPFERDVLWHRFRRMVEAAGLTSKKQACDLFHRLRRTNLSYTALGGGLTMAQNQAGHASAALTLRSYIDPRIVRQRSAADVLPPLDQPGAIQTPDGDDAFGSIDVFR
jgi:integrase